MYLEYSSFTIIILKKFKNTHLSHGTPQRFSLHKTLKGGLKDLIIAGSQLKVFWKSQILSVHLCSAVSEINSSTMLQLTAYQRYISARRMYTWQTTVWPGGQAIYPKSANVICLFLKYLCLCCCRSQECGWQGLLQSHSHGSKSLSNPKKSEGPCQGAETSAHNAKSAAQNPKSKVQPRVWQIVSLKPLFFWG